MSEQTELELQGDLSAGPEAPVLVPRADLAELEKVGFLRFDESDRIWRWSSVEKQGNEQHGSRRFLAASGRKYAHCEDLNGTEHKVIAYLAWRAGAKQVAWPSTKTIAEAVGRSRRTVQGAIRGLEGKGYLSTVPQGAKNGSNLYVLQVPTGAITGCEKLHPPVQKPAPEQVQGTSTTQYKEPVPKSQPELFAVDDDTPKTAGKSSELFAHLLPDSITQDVGAMVALGEFEQNRREMKKPMTPTAIKRLCRRIREWSPETIKEACGTAIDRNWQTLYEPKESQSGGASPSAAPAASGDDFDDWKETKNE